MKIMISDEDKTYSVESNETYPTWVEFLEDFTDLLRALGYILPEDLEEYLEWKKEKSPDSDAFEEARKEARKDAANEMREMLEKLK